ncbi:MAG: PASTA domain-containing protein [Bacilli bacterium]|nr:PASTA domain-containing protein [Bacilli bacterium]
MKKNNKNISYEKEIMEMKEKKKSQKAKKIETFDDNKMSDDFAFLNDKEEKKTSIVKDKIQEEIESKEKSILSIEKETNKKKKDNVIEFRGEEFTIKDETIEHDDEEVNVDNKYKKSKLCIFFLVLALIVILGYGYYLSRTLDFKNLELLDIVKSLSFVLISLIVILILFKVNTKKSAPYVILLTLILMGYSVFSVSYARPDILYVSDFVNKSYEEVLTWASSHDIELITLHEYSDTIPINYVIMQEYGITKPLSEIKTFTVTISDGPSPYKEIVVPNFIGFKYDDVMKYIKENYLSNVEIDFIISDKEKDTVIEQIGSGTMLRNDKIKFTFSYGSEIETEAVKDLKGLSLFEATSYLKRIGVKYELSYEFNEKIKKDYIISQDKINEVVESLKLVVSKGHEIVVPDLSKMSSTEISKWATSNNIKIKYESVYNTEVDAGKIIQVSKNESDKIEEGETITVTISLGSIIMPEVTSISEFKLWATSNNIPFQENYEFSTTVKNGDLIKVTPDKGTKITENDTIVLTISKGKSVTVPNFVGLTKTEVTNKCKNASLSCTFKYGGLTENTKKDIVTLQSKKSGITVAEGTNVTITLSSGIIEKVTVPSFNGKTKSEITNSCSSLGITCNFSYSSNFSETPKDTAISQDKTGTMNKGSTINITLSKGSAQTYTIVIDGSMLSLGNPEQTKNTLSSKLKNACPGVNFNFSFKSVNSGIGYLNPDSQVKVGSNTFTEGKTYNVIINSN